LEAEDATRTQQSNLMAATAKMAHNHCCGRRHRRTATSWQWAKRTTKMMATKQDKRGREAGAPANLTQQPTKEQEGHEGATSGGGAGQRSSSWLSSSLYRNVVAMGKNDNKNDDNKAR
jgi:hypothetical protein